MIEKQKGKFSFINYFKIKYFQYIVFNMVYLFMDNLEIQNLVFKSDQDMFWCDICID